MSQPRASHSVSLHDIAMHYGNIRAVDGVNLEIRAGEFMTFLGPSGSGKTTTLKIIAGFLQQSRGELRIDGNIVRDPPHKRDIGMVFQNYALFPHMSAAENVAFPLKMRGVPKGIRQQRVYEALERVHLSDRAQQKPRQLSGGQQQRVALARALVFEPKVVLMDEPLGALDKQLRERLQLEIRRLQQALHITMIYVTHDQEEALVMSDRISVFNQGKLEQVGSGADLYERPQSRFVADFIGESNIFCGQWRDKYFESQGARFAVAQPPADSGAYCLVVRPERLQLLRPDAALPAAHNSLSAQVSELIYLGSERKVVLQTANGHSLLCRQSVAQGELPWQAGDPVQVAWPIEQGVLVRAS